MTVQGLIVAIQLLTRIPTPSLEGEGARDVSGAAPWLPLVGLIVGAAVTGAVWAGLAVSPWFAACCGLAVWVVITGALHLDGLGDVADASGAAHGNPDRFTDVAQDPHTGSFAVVAIALQLVLKLVLIAEVARAGALEALLLIPAWTRWEALFVARAAPPLTDGLGSKLAQGTTLRAITIAGVILTLISLWVMPALLAAIILAAVASVYWRRTIGGMSGDCLGATIEVSETILLAAVLIAVGINS